ncbi:thiamine-phosphate pyrophosphorylase [Nitratifractor sp.]
MIDANLNRLKEGLRVLEDCQRYLFDNSSGARRFKELRHSLQRAYDLSRLSYRDIRGDVLKETTQSESRRANLLSLMIANFSRCQESARVLEEAMKINDPELSTLFKDLRYELYDLEREFLGSSSAKSNSNSR